MLWAKTSISSKELWIFNKNIDTLNIDTYVRERGEKKIYNIENYIFEFGVNEWTLEGYTRVNTPEGIIFEIKEPKYRNQKSVEIRFFVG